MKKIIALCFCVQFSICQAVCEDPPAPGVDWMGCQMDHALDLSRQSLDHSNLSKGRFVLVNMEKSDLREVNFTEAKLAYGRFVWVDARGANFTDAVLYHADFTNADLRGSNLTRAEVSSTKLKGADLTGAKWIDGSKLCGPGSIGFCK